MKFQSKLRRSNTLTAGFLVAPFLFAGSLGALTPNEWRFSQTIDVPANGLIRINLPTETLDASRPNLGDVRILDSAGREVPYLIDRPMPRHESALRSQELRTALEPTATQITLTTGTKSLLKGVTFETPPGVEFIKAVQVEGSHEGAQWRQLTLLIALDRAARYSGRSESGTRALLYRFVRVKKRLYFKSFLLTPCK